jgi:hypothetical protein
VPGGWLFLPSQHRVSIYFLYRLLTRLVPVIASRQSLAQQQLLPNLVTIASLFLLREAVPGLFHLASPQLHILLSVVAGVDLAEHVTLLMALAVVVVRYVPELLQ